MDFWLEVKGSEYLKSIFLYFSDGVCGDWGAWDGRFDAYRDVLVDTMMQLQPEYNGTWYSDLKGVRFGCLKYLFIQQFVLYAQLYIGLSVSYWVVSFAVGCQFHIGLQLECRM